MHFVGVCRALGINIARDEQYKVHNFSSTSASLGEVLKGVFFFQMSPRTMQRCAGNRMLPASYGLSEPV